MLINIDFKRAPTYRSIGVGLLSLVLSLSVQAREPDWQEYNTLLSEHVSSATRDGIQLNVVDYAALKSDPRLAKVSEMLQQFPLAALSSPEEQLAFYINAYNVFTLALVTEHWPLESIRDLGNWFSPVWKQTVGQLGGNAVTLDEIEHQILRPRGEPRVHFAIVCASLSCPDLRPEAYSAEHLEQQLDEQTKNFLGNATKGYVLDGNVVRISKIFDWFEEDFDALGGVMSFLRSYRTLPQESHLKANLKYNWRVNAK